MAEDRVALSRNKGYRSLSGMGGVGSLLVSCEDLWSGTGRRIVLKSVVSDIFI